MWPSWEITSSPSRIQFYIECVSFMEMTREHESFMGMSCLPTLTLSMHYGSSCMQYAMQVVGPALLCCVREVFDVAGPQRNVNNRGKLPLAFAFSSHKTPKLVLLSLYVCTTCTTQFRKAEQHTNFSILSPPLVPMGKNYLKLSPFSRSSPELSLHN